MVSGKGILRCAPPRIRACHINQPGDRKTPPCMRRASCSQQGRARGRGGEVRTPPGGNTLHKFAPKFNQFPITHPPEAPRGP